MTSPLAKGAGHWIVGEVVSFQGLKERFLKKSIRPENGSSNLCVLGTNVPAAFIEHRIGDRRIVRLIQKWLRAGVLEDGEHTRGEVGTVQGGSISPLLANIYLHYVLDLWVQQWRTRRAKGDVIIVRYADDFIVGFEHRSEAEQFQERSSAADGEVRTGSAPGQDPADRVWAVRRPGSRPPGPGESPRPSTSLVSLIAAGPTKRGGSRCGGRRCARSGRPS